MGTRMLQQEQLDRREVLDAMRKRQIAEEDELVHQLGDPESFSWLSSSEMALFYELRDRHLAEEREILGHVCIEVRRRRQRHR